MSAERGTVEKVEAGWAWVKTKRSSACSSSPAASKRVARLNHASRRNSSLRGTGIPASKARPPSSAVKRRSYPVVPAKAERIRWGGDRRRKGARIPCIRGKDGRNKAELGQQFYRARRAISRSSSRVSSIGLPRMELAAADFSIASGQSASVIP